MDKNSNKVKIGDIRVDNQGDLFQVLEVHHSFVLIKWLHLPFKTRVSIIDVQEFRKITPLEEAML
jgi:hypothetical protein